MNHQERSPGWDKPTLLASSSIQGPGVGLELLQRLGKWPPATGGLDRGLVRDLLPLQCCIEAWQVTTSRWGAGLSCADFSISSRKLMMLCSLASESSVPSSGGPGGALSFPNFSRLSAVRELALSSCEREGPVVGAVRVPGGLRVP